VVGFELRGHGGSLRCGYRTASVLGAWTLRRHLATLGVSETSQVEIEIVRRDPFWSEAQPLDLWLLTEKAHWIWRQVRVAPGVVTVTGDPDIQPL
jgi:hypothetical protein